MSSWTTIWELILVIAVLSSLAVVVFIITLPTTYTHFHPGHITEDNFTADDRRDAERSGYAFFEANKDDNARYATKVTVQVVVLGDIGRSPRMQYHAVSLAKHGAGVQLVGYIDSSSHPDVLASRFIKLVGISASPKVLQTSSKGMFLLKGPLKALYQTWALYKALAYHSPACRYMLVQNPPSIPVLAVAVFVCFFRNTRLVVDWHNFGYSILAMRLGQQHPLVKLSKWYEGFVCHGASAHFTVTDAMNSKVKQDFGISALTLHDRPAYQFQPFTTSQRGEFLATCDVTAPFSNALKAGSTRLVISSTSWTADEDFGVLLDALIAYTISAATDTRLPGLLVVITGKGPQQTYYLTRIQALEKEGKLAKVDIRLAWLSITDYASLLASADLGICLHTSSSGVDLPMKVLDMFGAGIPVAGWDKYTSWSELVHEGVNGLGFRSATGLQHILEDLFMPGNTKLQKLRHGASKEGENRWDQEWNATAAKLFQLG